MIIPSAFDIPADEGVVSVEYSEDRGPAVYVQWLCGDRHFFVKDDALQLVKHINLARDTGTVMHLEDSQGTDFYATVVNGNLYAAYEMSDMQGSAHVLWSDMKKAVRKVLQVR